jgi:VCBS repeat-containing protein
MGLDTLAPTVSAVIDSISSELTNAPMNFTVTFSESILGTIRVANFTANNASVTSVTPGTLANTYVVGVTPTANLSSGNVYLNLVGSGLTDAAGNALQNASLASLGSQAVDTLAANVVSVTTSGSKVAIDGAGTLNSGDTVTFTVNTSEIVTVTGSPSLVLNNKSNATDPASASYVSGSGTNALVFSYTVPSSAIASTTDLSVSAVNMTSATIKDAAGNNLIFSAAGYNPAGILAVSATNNQNPRPVADASAATLAGDLSAVSAQGNLLTNDSDPDLGDELTVFGASLGQVSLSGVASFTTSATLNGAYGSLLINTNGSYIYTPAANAAIGRDDTPLTDVFTYAVSDGKGGSAAAQLTVTVNGANNSPVVATTDVTGAVTELVTAAGSLTDTGTIAFTDVDLTDEHSFSTVVASAGALGALTVVKTSDTTGTGTGGVLTWSYSVAASAVEYLAAGQTKTETFAFNVLDGKGGSVPRTVTVTVTGTNDAPVLTLNTDNTAVTFESGMGASGSVASTILTTRTDVDTLDVQAGYPTFVSSLVSSAIGTDWVATGANLYSRVGNFGTATLNADTGTVTYQLNQSNAETQALSKLQNDYDRFTLNITDGRVMTTQVAAFQVVGADDTLAWNAAASNADGAQDIKIFRAEGGRTAVHVDWIATDPDSSITYTATLIGASTSSSFALVNNGGQLSGLVSLSSAFATGAYTLRINANSQDGQSISKDFTARIDASTPLSGQVLTGSATNGYLNGSSLTLDNDGNAVFIAGAGNDVFDGAKASHAFAGGEGDDTVVFNSSTVTFSASGKTYLQLSMLPTFKAAEMADYGLLSSQFATAVSAVSTGANNYAFLSVNTNAGVSYVQAENILISYDLAAGSTTTVAFNIGADSTGSALLNLSGQADRVVAGFLSDNIDAGAGDDVVYGAGNGSSSANVMAADIILGGAGDDILAAGTWTANKSIQDNLLDDAVLDGGQGDDVLVAVSGKVTATGGTGRDVFAIYNDHQNVNLFITDFNASVDRIDLSAFTALKNLAQPSQVLATMVQQALGNAIGSVIELDFTQYMGAHNTDAVAKVTLTTPVAGGQLSEQSFIFDKPDWSATNWQLNLDPLVHP